MLRRYSSLKPSRGTAIPDDLRKQVMARDRHCVAIAARLPGECDRFVELDHVRASHGMGMKSETSRGNLVALCGRHHRWKTSNGKVARPLLLAYLERVEGEHTHVEPVHGCPQCVQPVDPYVVGLTS